MPSPLPLHPSHRQSHHVTVKVCGHGFEARTHVRKWLGYSLQELQYSDTIRPVIDHPLMVFLSNISEIAALAIRKLLVIMSVASF